MKTIRLANAQVEEIIKTGKEAIIVLTCLNGKKVTVVVTDIGYEDTVI